MNCQQKGLKAKSKKQNPFLDSWHSAGKACYPFRPPSLVELVHNRSAALQQLLLRFRIDQTNKVEGATFACPWSLLVYKCRGGN